MCWLIAGSGLALLAAWSARAHAAIHTGGGRGRARRRRCRHPPPLPPDASAADARTPTGRRRPPTLPHRRPRPCRHHAPRAADAHPRPRAPTPTPDPLGRPAALLRHRVAAGASAAAALAAVRPHHRPAPRPADAHGPVGRARKAPIRRRDVTAPQRGRARRSLGQPAVRRATPFARAAPASITKIVTTIVALEHGPDIKTHLHDHGQRLGAGRVRRIVGHGPRAERPRQAGDAAVRDDAAERQRRRRAGRRVTGWLARARTSAG